MKPQLPTLLILSLLISLFMGMENALSQGFKSITELDPISIDAGVGTEDISQSKTFVHDGKHWTVLANSTGTHLWRLDGKSWTHIIRLTTRKGRADIKVIGNLAHVFVYQSNIAHLVSLEYVSSTKTYQPWSQRSSIVEFSFNKELRTASIDVDGTGRMWLAYVRNSRALVQSSASPYNSWSSPIVLDPQVRSDDVATVIAMPGKIGVFWSNQVTKRFGFKTHTDGDAITNWSADESPASQSALDIGAGMADDHMNLKLTSDGTLYCAIKTGYNNASHPLIALLVRRPSGNWENLHNVSNSGTTPIAIVNEAAGKIKVIYVSQTYGGDILYKESSLSNISFGPEQILMKGGSIRDASASKGTYSSEVVIVANDKPNNRAVSVLASYEETTANIPGSISLISPTNSATNVELSPTLSWNAASGADTYHLQVSTSSSFNSTVTDRKGITTTASNISDLSNATEYFWRVRGSSGAGDGPWSNTWRFTTLSGSSGGGDDLVGHWKMEEGSGNVLIDHSGYDNTATLKSAAGIGWSPGVEGLGLDLPGTRDRFGEAENHPSLNITDAITISVWIKPNIIKSKTIISKVSPNGYQLNTTHKGKLEFRVNADSHGTTYRIISNGSYPSNGNTWMHVVATFDGQTAKIYLNGAEDNSVTFNTPVKIGTNTSKLTIGAYESSLRFFGSIDELRLYRKVLSADEAQQLYSVPQTLSSSNYRQIMVGEVLDHPFEEQSGDLLIENVAADSLPDWLIYVEAENLLTGIPSEKDLGSITLRISNLSKEGLKLSEKFLELRVENQTDDWRKIQSREGGKNIRLYPNPIIDRLFIESSGLEQEEFKISIYDTNGKLHLELNTKIDSTVTEIDQINQVIGNGVYLVIIEGNNFRDVFKMLKK